MSSPASSADRSTTPIELPPSAVDLIVSGAHAHLVTINPDGSPQCSIVWSDIQDGEICIPSFKEWQKVRNVRRDPRVVVSYESTQANPRTGLRYYLVVKGTARVTEGGASELSRILIPRYSEPGKVLPSSSGDPEGFIMRISPLRMTGNGPWMKGE